MSAAPFSEFWSTWEQIGKPALDARSVPCPTCGATVGYCKRPSGHKAMTAHAARWDAALAAAVAAHAASSSSASLSSDESASLAEMPKKKNEPEAEPRPVGRPARAGEAAERKISIRGTEDEIGAWERAAKAKGQPLSPWLRDLANRAAARSSS